MSDQESFHLHYDRSDARRLLEDPETSGVAVYCLALHALGVEALHGEEAELLEVYMDLESKFGAKLPHETEAKLQAVSLLVSTDAFFDTPHALHAISVALTQGDIEVGADFSVDHAEWEEIQWALFCASLLRAEDEEPHFSTGVMAEMVRAIKESGLETEAKKDAETFMEGQKAKLAEDLKTLGVPEKEILLEFKRAQK